MSTIDVHSLLPTNRIAGERSNISRATWIAFVIILVVGCVSGILFGIGSSLNFSWRAGASGNPPTDWPAGIKSITLDDKPLVLVFLHPKCPCSRATIDELSTAISHGASHARFVAIFEQPPGMDDRWVETDTWTKAESIPVLVRVRDFDGRLSSLFDVRTSGETVVYSPQGKLLFHGGLTLGRDHRGENAGRSFIESLATRSVTMSSSTCSSPVFGCPLCAGASPPLNVTMETSPDAP